MSFDAIRVPLRIATIAAMVAAVVVLFALLGQIQIPLSTTDTIVKAYSIGLAILQHYAGGFMWLISYTLILYTIKIALIGVKYALVFYRFILKIWS